MVRLALMALASLTLGRAAHAQSGGAASAQFTCGEEDSAARRGIDATFAGSDKGSVSDILGRAYHTRVWQKKSESLASEIECRSLVATLTSTVWADLAGLAVSFYKVDVAGGQPNVFVAYATTVLSDEPDIIEVAEDLVFVFDASYTLLFYTLAANPADF